MLGEEEETYVWFERVSDALDVSLYDRPDGCVGAGVVEEKVDAACRAVGDGLDGGLDAVGVGDIELYTLDGAGELAQTVHAACGRKYAVRRALGGELDSEGAPDTGRAAGDEDYLALVVERGYLRHCEDFSFGDDEDKTRKGKARQGRAGQGRAGPM